LQQLDTWIHAGTLHQMVVMMLQAVTMTPEIVQGDAGNAAWVLGSWEPSHHHHHPHHPSLLLLLLLLLLLVIIFTISHNPGDGVTP
jgi:hypothetical protein